MTIRSAILADNPTLYWPLDDVSAPAAADLSGNGNTGVYGGNFFLQQPGPEVGTFAVRFNSTGLCQTLAASPRLLKPWTIELWAAPVAIQPGLQGAVAYNGNGGADGAGVVWLAASPISCQYLRGGVGSSGVSAFFSDPLWHQLAWSHDAGNLVSFYQDGALQTSLAGQTTNALGGLSKFFCGPSGGADFVHCAHCAFFPSVLTLTQISAHYTARENPQNPANVGAASQASLDAMSGLLEKIYAAVHKTY